MGRKRSIKSWLEKIDIEMYSTCNEAKVFVAERLFRTLKLKPMTSHCEKYPNFT